MGGPNECAHAPLGSGLVPDMYGNGQSLPSCSPVTPLEGTPTNSFPNTPHRMSSRVNDSAHSENMFSSVSPPFLRCVPISQTHQLMKAARSGSSSLQVAEFGAQDMHSGLSSRFFNYDDDILSFAALSPDPTGLNQSIFFGSREQCPPTPNPPRGRPRLGRVSSLLDKKILEDFSSPLARMPLPKLDAIFEMEFDQASKVGNGSFFEVYRAHNVKDGRWYAVKKSINPFRGKNDRDLYMREVRLVKCMHELGYHRNMIRYYKAWQEDQHFFVQMEFCDCNLSEYVARAKWRNVNAINETFLRACACQLACGLAFMHNHQLMHLDIKPDNVLLVTNGNNNGLQPGDPLEKLLFKLGDFGLMRRTSDIVDGGEGDCQYMAQEMLQNDGSTEITVKADVFSLGLLLFELATDRKLPSSGSMWQDLRQGRAAGYLRNNASVGNGMRQMILDMLHPDHKQRPSAHQIYEMLR